MVYTTANDRVPSQRQSGRRGHVELEPHKCEDLADLSAATIACMTREELVDLLRDSNIPFLSAEGHSRMQHWDLPTLQRVLHLARRCQAPSCY